VLTPAAVWLCACVVLCPGTRSATPTSARTSPLHSAAKRVTQSSSASAGARTAVVARVAELVHTQQLSSGCCRDSSSGRAVDRCPAVNLPRHYLAFSRVRRSGVCTNNRFVTVCCLVLRCGSCCVLQAPEQDCAFQRAEGDPRRLWW
jgi:hypothetical protein